MQRFGGMACTDAFPADITRWSYNSTRWQSYRGVDLRTQCKLLFTFILACVFCLSNATVLVYMLMVWYFLEDFCEFCYQREACVVWQTASHSHDIFFCFLINLWIINLLMIIRTMFIACHHASVEFTLMNVESAADADESRLPLDQTS